MVVHIVRVLGPIAGDGGSLAACVSVTGLDGVPVPAIVSVLPRVSVITPLLLAVISLPLVSVMSPVIEGNTPVPLRVTIGATGKMNADCTLIV